MKTKQNKTKNITLKSAFSFVFCYCVCMGIALCIYHSQHLQINYLTVCFYPKAPIPQELGGTLQGFIVKHRKQNADGSVFSEVRLDANTRQYVLNNLKVFTVYEVKLAAVNEKGPGPYTPLYRVTTGEKRKLNFSLKNKQNT